MTLHVYNTAECLRACSDIPDFNCTTANFNYADASKECVLIDGDRNSPDIVYKSHGGWDVYEKYCEDPSEFQIKIEI